MPSRKIFDINPPQRRSKSLEPQKESERLQKPFSSIQKFTPLFLGFSLLLGGVLGYLLIPAKAKIEIWPKKENIEETITVAVVPDQRSGNFLKGEISELERIVSQEFIAQGAKIKAVKASGIIRVYNG